MLNTTDTATVPNFADFESVRAIAEQSDTLREKVLVAARANDGALMGEHAWLRYGVTEQDVTLVVRPNGVEAHGQLRAMRSTAVRDFRFFVPFKELAKHA